MRVLSVGIVLIAAFISTAAYAGSLEPTAPPSSGGTMKTLDQVEPRIPIPGATVAAGTYTISASGSYYLTGDRLCSGQGISIYADNVTIDLCGYSLIGSGSSGSGITIWGRSNVEIRNGTIRGFYWHGIAENNTNDNAKNHSLIGVRVIGNALLSSSYYGISLPGKNHRITDCTAAGNNGSGIYTGDCSTVSNNSVRSNALSGIFVATGCTVIGNTSSANSAYGITTSSGCTIINNTVYSNGNSGIYSGHGCIIKSNTSRANASGSGINTGEQSVVIGNAVTNNTGFGIFCGTFCLLDQNIAINNSLTNMFAPSGTLGTNLAP